uniref:Uncharacterized protein n=1 Tax=Rhizophora mucronata TaxID=61149 RepID=A0A2P2MAN4_RHIMU
MVELEFNLLSGGIRAKPQWVEWVHV